MSIIIIYWDGILCILQWHIYIYVYIYMYIYIYIRAARKSAVRFYQFLWWRLSLSCAKCCVFHVHATIHWYVRLRFPLWSVQNACFRVVKTINMHSKHPIFVYEEWGRLRLTTAPALLFHLCSDEHNAIATLLTYDMIIGFLLDKLPGSIFLHAFQQLSIVPAWATTLGLPLWTLRTVRLNWPLLWFTLCVIYSRLLRQLDRQELCRWREDVCSVTWSACKGRKHIERYYTPPTPQIARRKKKCKNAWPVFGP